MDEPGTNLCKDEKAWPVPSGTYKIITMMEVCLNCSGAALQDSWRRWGDCTGSKDEQVFADSILTFKKDFVAASGPLPLPWVENQKKKSVMFLICSIIQCLVEYSSSTKVPNHNNHNPGRQHWPWTPPRFPWKAAVKCSVRQGHRTYFFSLAGFVPGQSARYTMLPGLRGRQNSRNRWN